MISGRYDGAEQRTHELLMLPDRRLEINIDDTLFLQFFLHIVVHNF